MIAVTLLAAFLVAPAAADRQAPRGRLVVTVMDQSQAVIPNATVTVTGPAEAAEPAAPRVAVTSGVGVATFEPLPAGHYTVQAAFPGFDAVLLREVRVRNGETRRSVVLPIAKIDQQTSVSREKQAAALDPQGAAFSTVLTREQIDALPDDPDEMEKVLKAMAPPGAVIRVDGFTGGKLPPKSQIRSIRLPKMDMMAAQNHGGLQGMVHIDIMTQPGMGPLGGSADFAFRNDALNARNPFSPAKGSEGLQRYGVAFGGTVKPNRSSFSFAAQGAAQYDTNNLMAALPAGTRADPVRQPTDSLNFNLRFDQAIKKDHALRLSVQRSSFDRRNQGIGGFDMPERAYTSSTSETLLRISENGPIGRRYFGETRFQLRWSGNEDRSALEAPTIRVLDAFTRGGAQQAGGTDAVEFEAAGDLDYVRGRHSMRMGVLLEGGRYHSNDSSNYLGTFTFSSLADYEAGRPALFTRRVGDPDVRFSNLQAGLYVQDDFRVLKSVMLSYGLRYEAQTLVRDQNNVSPRVSVSWTPAKSGKTTIRGGWGFFSDWLGTSTYRQTLQVDGVRQQEIQILDPGYPDPGTAGVTPPTSRYLLDGGLQLPESMRLNAGLDQQVIGTLRVNAAYTYARGLGLLRGRNLNAPILGIRPDPSLANVIEVEGDAGSTTHSVNLSASMLLMNWHRTVFAVNYNWTKSDSNTGGAFWLPAVADLLDGEWGPAQPRHRFGATFATQIVPAVGISLNARAQSGTPYNITTGMDSNQDGVFNDRPAGVSRNSALTAPQWEVGTRLTYTIGFGKRRQGAGQVGGTQVMVQIGGPGGGMPSASISSPSDKRYQLQFYAAAQNVTNHPNYVGYSGVMTSPFFGEPTSVLGQRKIELGMRFGF